MAQPALHPSGPGTSASALASTNGSNTNVQSKLINWDALTPATSLSRVRCCRQHRGRVNG